MRKHPGSTAWLDDIDSLAATAAARFHVTIDGPPYQGGMVSVVLPARGADGTPLVLKLQWPHRESEHEAAALAHWDGRGAVRLLDHDAELHALLLERCEPGTPLSAATLDEAIDAMSGLVRQLAVPATGAPFTTLADEAAHWRETNEREWTKWGRPFERELLGVIDDLLERLAATQGDQVLLHQDLHADNVLRAGDGWRAIDPKPLVGEAEFMLAGFLRSFDYWKPGGSAPTAFGGAHDRASVLRRLDECTARTGLDRDRARDWAVAQLISWCFDSDYRDLHVQTARWLLEA